MEQVIPADVAGAEPTIGVAAVYAEHADFVWATLQRFGVREPDLEDLLQEVFVVVHQRLHTFDRSARMTTWLFGICLRVASGYRRRAHRRRETVGNERLPEARDGGASPEEAAASEQAVRRLHALLDELDLEKRAVFVMFEIDEMPCDQIAATMGVPVGTVYSRLHAARRQLEKALHRCRARDAQGGFR